MRVGEYLWKKSLQFASVKLLSKMQRYRFYNDNRTEEIIFNCLFCLVTKILEFKCFVSTLGTSDIISSNCV